MNIILSTELERLGAKPIFKGYQGFLTSLCVSVNDDIIHGIPGKRILHQGDIVSLDPGTITIGFQADAEPEILTIIDTRSLCRRKRLSRSRGQ